MYLQNVLLFEYEPHGRVYLQNVLLFEYEPHDRVYLQNLFLRKDEPHDRAALQIYCYVNKIHTAVCIYGFIYCEFKSYSTVFLWNNKSRLLFFTASFWENKTKGQAIKIKVLW